MLSVFSDPYRSPFRERPSARFASGRGSLFVKRPGRIAQALILLILLVLPFKLAAQDIGKIVRQIGPSVVTIITYDASGSPEKQGSGVFVAKNGLILTNAHVIDGVYSLKVVSSIGEFSEATVVLTDRDRDLALLQVMTDSAAPVREAESVEYEVGDKVVAIGSPMGLEGTVSDGMISGLREMQNGVELIQTTAPISPGSSGGALLNSDGNLIGITTETVNGAQNINFALGLKTITDFKVEYHSLKAAGEIQPVALPSAGSSHWYSVAWKWTSTSLLVLLAAILSPGLFGVVWLIGIGLFLVSVIVGGTWKILSLPFKKRTNKKFTERRPRKAEEPLGNLRVEAVNATEANIDTSEATVKSQSDSDVGNVLEDIHPPMVAVLLEEQTVRSLLTRKLRSRGFNAIGFGEKEELLHNLPSLMPDVVITDRNPPGWEGFDLAKAIKSEPKTKHIPVISVIAHSNVQSGIVSWRLGGPDFMPTPCDIDGILNAVIQSLNK
jgi:CheY-like chemotaxis protein